jgi:hypothetical protein
MNAYVRLIGAPIGDVRRDGTLYRYCASCDAHYAAGHSAEHRRTDMHRATMRDRRAMAAWYRANGS